MVGRGSTFLVQVPMVASGDAPREAVREEDGADLQGRAVLVIDDEPALCRAMVEVLGRWGCRVRTAESVPDALPRLAAESFVPDLIVAD